MPEVPHLPVVVPSTTSTQLTLAQARALADHWVSEHNRLPLRFAASSHDDSPWSRKHQHNGFRVVILLVTWLGRTFGNLASGALHRLRGAAVRRQQRDDFALDAVTEQRLRRAFAAALQDPRVRAMTDAEQRRHLGDVVFAAQSDR